MHRFRMGALKAYHAKIDAYCKQGWKQTERVSSHALCSAKLVHPNGHRLFISIDPQGGELHEEVL